MVEWKKLGEIAQLQKTRNKKHVTEKAYSITQAGLVPTKSFFKEKTNITSSDTSGYYIVKKDWFVYSPSRIDVGSINYLKEEGPVIVSPIDVVFSIDGAKCSPSYLLNYFFTYEGKKKLLRNREGVEGMGRRNLPFDAIKNITIPIPSLSEQERIVGILDTFTASIDNLKAQIAQRRKQYEFYRDQLLDLEGKEGVEMKTIKELCSNICSGGTPSTSHKEYYDGNIPWLRTQEVDWKDIYDTEIKITEEAIEKSSAKLIPADCIIVAMYGATAAKVAINRIPLCTNQACCNLEINNVIADTKYVYYWLCKEYKNLKSMGEGSQNNINGQKIKSYPIYLPSLSVQHRIVSILDTFESSIQNLEAQLEQREKQYEYYRNKLLTFE